MTKQDLIRAKQIEAELISIQFLAADMAKAEKHTLVTCRRTNVGGLEPIEHVLSSDLAKAIRNAILLYKADLEKEFENL